MKKKLMGRLLCKPGTLDRAKAHGKIVVCLRGDNARVDKGQQALQAGAVGMILANNILTGNEVIADPHVLPASQISYSDGISLFTYVNSTKYDNKNRFNKSTKKIIGLHG